MSEVPLYAGAGGDADGGCGRKGPSREERGPPSSSSLLLSSLELRDTKVYEPEIRARLGTAAHFCEVVEVEVRHLPPTVRCRATRQQLDRFHGLSPESQDQNLVLTVFYVPSSLDSGRVVRSEGLGAMVPAGSGGGEVGGATQLVFAGGGGRPGKKEVHLLLHLYYSQA